MLEKILVLLPLAAVTLALNASVAAAAETTADCGFESLHHEAVSGQHHVGVVWGVATDPDGDAVRFRCYVTVNDVAAPGRDVGASGDGVAAAARVIEFDATEDDQVRLCTEIDGVTVQCAAITNRQLPPQEVIDAIDSVFQLIADATAGLDPIICGALRAAGVPALVNSTTAVTTLSLDTDDCDIYLGGEQLVDFVPHGA